MDVLAVSMAASWPVAHCAQNTRYTTFANDPRNVFLHYYEPAWTSILLLEIRNLTS